MQVLVTNSSKKDQVGIEIGLTDRWVDKWKNKKQTDMTDNSNGKGLDKT